MAKPKHERIEADLVYPGHLLKPEDLLSFIESRVFQRTWKDCGLADDELFQLQLAIMIDPKGHPVVKDTGGMRKMRFSPADSSRGKSGSYRACYVYYEEFGIVYLVIAYPKNKTEDLSADTRKKIRKMIEEQHELLSRGPIR